MKSRTHRAEPARVAAVMCLSVIAGLLLWQKLKMTQPIPRTAIAEPVPFTPLPDAPVASAIRPAAAAER